MRRDATAANGSGAPTAEAEMIGLRALHHLAETGALIGFCTETGVSQADLMHRATEPALLGAVLDFLLQDDHRLSEFCTWADIAPEAVAAARRKLPGAPPEW